MAVTTPTDREPEPDVSRADSASRHGRVSITDLGKAAPVLSTIEDERRLKRERPAIADALAMLYLFVSTHFLAPNRGHFGGQCSRLADIAVRPADLS